MEIEIRKEEEEIRICRPAEGGMGSAGAGRTVEWEAEDGGRDGVDGGDSGGDSGGGSGRRRRTAEDGGGRQRRTAEEDGGTA